jgi:hypothetical protein
MNLATDLSIVWIPVPILLHARLNPARRIGLTLLLSAGVFVMTAAVLRVVYILNATTAGGAAAAAIWSCRETLVAVVAANAVFLLPLSQRSFWQGRKTRPTTRASRGLYKKQHSVRRKFRHPLEMSTSLGATWTSPGIGVAIESSGQERNVEDMTHQRPWTDIA